MNKKSFAVAVSLALMAVLMAGASAIAQVPRPTLQARQVQPVAVVGDLLDLTKAHDGRLDTRATSGRRNYVGQSVTLDVGGQQNIIGVYQEHGRWPTHYPGRIKVEVAESANGPWFETHQGAGGRAQSRALFEAVKARFIRVTATEVGPLSDEWSIAELHAIIDPGQTARNIPDPRDRRDDRDRRDRRDDRAPQRGPSSRIEGKFREIENAIDRKPDTRATTGTPDYVGTFLTFDLGGEYELAQVVQLHGVWPNDYPGEYKIEISRRKDEDQFREVWRGRGEPVRSVARFDREYTTRYVRITALKNRGRNYWWSIAELTTNRDREVVERDDDDDTRLAREIRSARAQGLSNIEAVLGNSIESSATTGRTNYAGSWVWLDLGGSYTISKLVQIHAPKEGDFPARYRIEVSQNGSRWETVWEGEGSNGRSRATFDPVRARFIRITATAERGRNWWSISKFRILE